jgi:prolipoprotein diacylglyceryltransferase
MLTPLVLLYVTLRARLDAVRNDDRGMTTEAMIITAILAGVALAVVGLIAAAITRKGNEIESDIDAALVLF